MFYLDTSLVIAYGIEGDPNHERAVDVIEKIKKKFGISEFYTSTFTLVELYAVLSRNIQKYRLPPGIEELANSRKKLQATIKYLLQLLSICIFSDNSELVNLNGLKLFNKFSEAINLSTELKLKSSDLLHIAYVSQLAKKKVIKFFITFDAGILKQKEAILKNTGIEVISNITYPSFRSNKKENNNSKNNSSTINKFSPLK
jgi:predicted nucleic acid-binding protein